MADIFDEIQEEILRDDFFTAVRAWLPYIVSVTVAILVGTASYLFYENHMENLVYRDEGQYDRALQLLDEKNIAGAREALENILKNGTDGYRFLANLQLASLDHHDFSLSASEKAVASMSSRYNGVATEYGAQFKNFFAGVEDLIAMETRKRNGDIEKIIAARFSSPRNVWAWYNGCSSTVWDIIGGASDTDSLSSELYSWMSNSDGAMTWLIEMVSVGTGAPIFDKENVSKEMSLDRDK